MRDEPRGALRCPQRGRLLQPEKAIGQRVYPFERLRQPANGRLMVKNYTARTQYNLSREASPPSAARLRRERALRAPPGCGASEPSERRQVAARPGRRRDVRIAVSAAGSARCAAAAETGFGPVVVHVVGSLRSAA